MDVFGTDDEDKICRLILADGDLQVCLLYALVTYTKHIKGVSSQVVPFDADTLFIQAGQC